ncbi:MAG: hypothetical protein M0Z78_09755 [Betaproteobacteria bacterium]|jgi:hypothetical protein|nr:hypothetical protein [Betaproteobacteria bacterium]
MSPLLSKKVGITLYWSAILLAESPTLWADDDFIVYSPQVTYGQSEAELRGFHSQDARPGLNGLGAFESSIAHTFTDWWKVEFYTSTYEQTPGLGTQYSGQELENTFQLTETGQYPVDVGLLASYAQVPIPGLPNSLEIGPLLQTRLGYTEHILNIICQKDVGAGALPGCHMREAYSFRYRLTTPFSPGFEAYNRPFDRARQLGPAFYGEFKVGHGGKELEYSAALLYGTNYGAPDRTMVLRLEYEFF